MGGHSVSGCRSISVGVRDVINTGIIVSVSSVSGCLRVMNDKGNLLLVYVLT